MQPIHPEERTGYNHGTIKVQPIDPEERTGYNHGTIKVQPIHPEERTGGSRFSRSSLISLRSASLVDALSLQPLMYSRVSPRSESPSPASATFVRNIFE